jgi:hypothetical protein
MFSDTATVVSQICTHLEWLGYKLERRDKVVLARHDMHHNFLLQETAGVLMFKSSVTMPAEKKADHSCLMQLVNSINTEAVLVRAYVDADSDLALEAWHPIAYEKDAFGHFHDIWSRDTTGLLRKYFS